MCEENIPKGTKTLNENAFSKTEGYTNCYFHLNKDCALDYIDIVQPTETKDISMILGAIPSLTKDDIASHLQTYFPSKGEQNE